MKAKNWLLSSLVFCTLASLTARTLPSLPGGAHYVWQGSPSPAPPYRDWATAAHTIQDAVDAASAGDTVVVTNGVYSSGGRAVGTNALVNRVAVDKPITLQSLNGPQVTIIQGYQVPDLTNGDGAIRCVYLTNGAVLSGFTLANGGTRRAGDYIHEQSGGGLWCESANGTVSNCTLAGNVASGSGGGAFWGTLNHCNLTGNSASVGGGAFLGTLSHCNLTGNSATTGGGAEAATLNNCTLTNNSASSLGGGASDSTLNLCSLTGNSADEGGGVYQSTLNNCTLTRNGATYGGGAEAGNLNNCTLTTNSAYCGGGAFGSTLSNCSLTRNSASYLGGGAVAGNLNNCTLTGNAADEGGGVYHSTLNNCTLTGNAASQYGGGVYQSTLNNCTLSGNAASQYGGGAYESTLNNCIVYFNAPANSPNYDSGSVLNFCCTTPLPPSGNGNITADPQLASTSHLSAYSPCRGAGSAAYATGTDVDGEPWASPPSIGCDEFRPGSIIGPLSVAIRATDTNVAPGIIVGLTALIEGQTTASGWDFGDGVVVSNQPYTAHAWTSPGDYAVALTAYNDSYPEGVSATQMVHVVLHVYYVAPDSTNAAAPYSSWDTAAHTIQDAVDAAAAGGTVLVSNGMYVSGGRAVHGGTTNRVAVYKPLTLTSVNGAGFTAIQGYQLPGSTNGDGAIRCVYLTNGAVLSGFTLTNGATRSAGDANREQSGGGLWCESADAMVSNCVLTGNSAAYLGGGAEAGTLNNCTLTNNSASYLGGGASASTLNNCTLTSNSAYCGGGASASTLNDCTLTGNSATITGGGGGAYESALNNCTLTGNAASSYGGGVYQSTLNNCTVTGNSVTYYGGGAYESTLNNCTLTANSAWVGGGASDSTLSNCTVTGNSATYGGGASEGTLNNCILYHNTANSGPNYYAGVSGITNSYCCTTPMPTNGVGTITNEPAFVDFAGGNLRLQSNSPCINAGDNTYVTSTTDLDGNPRIALGTVDIGAYEYQGAGSTISYAWLQQYGLSTSGSDDLADTDGDGQNNYQEWVAGTNPTNAASVLRLTILSNSLPVAVTFSSSAARRYTLQCCTNLTPSSVWTPVPGQTDLHGNDAVLTLSDTNPPAPAFYRVSVRLP